MRNPLPEDPRTTEWIDSFSDRHLAEVYVRYALAYNMLDEDWLSDLFAADVSYESQSVFDTIEGRAAVLPHIEGKIRALASDSTWTARFELATTPSKKPTLAGFQSVSSLDRNWMEKPLLNVALTLDEAQLVKKVFIITVVPSPAHVNRSGVFPGIPGAVHENPRGVLRPREDYHGLEIEFILLNGQMGLDREMLHSASTTLAELPSATSRILVAEDDDTATQDAISRAQLVAFPSVVAYWHGEILYRHQGLIRGERLAALLKEALQLHVVE